MTGYGAVRLRDEVLRSYDELMGLLSRPSVRRALVAASRTSGLPWNSAAPESYQRIHDLSDTLMAALTRFVIDRANEWPINFFRNWLL